MRWTIRSIGLLVCLQIVLVPEVRSLRIQRRQQRQQSSRRQEVISDFLQTLKKTPKAHSLSPSWNGQSQYQVIPINHLPLQNEVNLPSGAGDGIISRDFRQITDSSQSELAASDARPQPNGGRFKRLRLAREEQSKAHHSTNQQPNRRHPANGFGEHPGASRRKRPSSPRRSFGGQGRRAQGNSEKPFRRSPSAGQFETGHASHPKATGGENFASERAEFRNEFPRRSSRPGIRGGGAEGGGGVEVSKVLRKRPGLSVSSQEDEPQDVHRYDFELGSPKYAGESMARRKTNQRMSSTKLASPTAFSGEQLGGEYPGFRSNPFLDEEHGDFPRQFFEQAPAAKKDEASPKGDENPGRYFSPEEDVRPPLAPKRPQTNRRPARPSPGYERDTEFLPKKFTDRPSSRPEYPEDTDIQRGFKPFSDDFGPDGPNFQADEGDVAKFKLFGDDGSPLNSGPSVEFETRTPPRYKRPYTTPRPIPTPGPEDFPTPPPRPPTLPPTHPTHPTHPPAITHPPEHYRPKFEAPGASFDFGPEYFAGDIPRFSEEKGPDRDSSQRGARPAYLDNPSIQPGPPYRDTVIAPQSSSPFEMSDISSFEESAATDPFPGMGSNPFAERNPYEVDDKPSLSVPKRNFKTHSHQPDDRSNNHRIPEEMPYESNDRGSIPSRNSEPTHEYDQYGNFPTRKEPAYEPEYYVPQKNQPKVSYESQFPRPKPLAPTDAFKTHRNDHFTDGESEAALEASEGFFTMPENFPSLEALGSGFESMKIRNKRSADTEKEMLSQERRFVPNIRRSRRNRNLRQESNRYSSNPQQRRDDDFGLSRGFWEDVDTEFYPHNRNAYGQRQQPYNRRNNRNQYESSSSPRRPPNYSYQSSPGFSTYPSRHRDPYPQSSVQSFPKNNGYERDTYNVQDEKDNEILGSGNFEVIKGGTFFDEDTYYQSSYNRRPQPIQNGDFLENFRDFADIKGDIYQQKYY